MIKKLLLFFILIFGISYQSLNSQCTSIPNNACTTAAPIVVGNSITCTPPNTNGGRENFLVTNMISGSTYRISNCGSGFDTQMTIRDLVDNVVGYNDDNGPACAGTAASIDFIPPTTGDYRIQLNRYFCGTANNFNGDIVVTLISGPPTSYCIPTSTSSIAYIDDFSTSGGITNITNNNSGYSAGGYVDNTAQTVSQFAGGTINFDATYVGLPGAGIWIDWNGDFLFNDPSEVIYLSNAYVNNTNISYVVPGGTPVGTYRMRVLVDFWETTPDPCSLDPFGPDGEGEDYTLEVISLNCTDDPTNISITNITENTADLSWDPPTTAPNGYSYYVSTNANTPNFNDTPVAPGGTTVSPITSAALTLTQNTTYYVWVRSDCGAGDLGAFIGPVSFTTLSEPPVTTGASICQYGSGTISATASCNSSSNTNTINGNLDASIDNTAIQPIIFISDADGCAFDAAGDTANYTTTTFQVDVSGTYSFASDAPNFDAMGYIVEDPSSLFNPGSCAGEGVNWTWITGDDDSGPGLEAILTANLTAGVTYTLYTTAFSFTDVLETEAFTWNISGPGSLSLSTSGFLQWYNNATGGAPIGSGSPFNPVGGASDLPNTDVPGTYTFYAACSLAPNVRTETIFEIIEAPTVAISGTGNACGPTAINITLTLTGSQPWDVTYSDGITPITISGITSSPYVFSVTPSTATTYTLVSANDSNCNANASGLSGSAVISGGKVWDGSEATNDWMNPLNWSDNVIPSATDCIVIPVTGNDPVIYDNSDGDGLNLTIENGATLTLISDTDANNFASSLTIQDWIDIQGTGQLIIQNDASLIQVYDSSTTTPPSSANSGAITLYRNTEIRNTDYVYWSSPVANFDISNVYGAFTPTDFIYEWIPTVPSPFTGPPPGNVPVIVGDWNAINSGIMSQGKGYIVRGPTNHTTTVSTATALFNGIPNNGVINQVLSSGNYSGTPFTYNPYGVDNLTVTQFDDNWNLLGNPYPSAIDAQSFLTHPSNSTIEGAVHIWTHGSQLGSYSDSFYDDFLLTYNINDYITYNFSGTNTYADESFDGKIASGQGFFVLALNDNETGSVTFNNSMRNRIHANTNFYRSSEESNGNDTLERHRIWLNLVDDIGTTSNIMVGYIEGATQEKDRLYDAYTRESNSLSIYSIINDDRMVIQGRALPFNINDEVPIGTVLPDAGQYMIAIDNVDGLFLNNDQNIYLEDLYLNVVHNLRAAPYYFSVDNEIDYSDRFILRYTNETLSIEDNELKGLIIMAPGSEYISIKSQIGIIKSVDVYDIVGRLILNVNDVNDQHFKLEDTNFSAGSYIVKVELINGKRKVQKIILKH